MLVEDNRGDVRLIEEAFKRGRIDHTLHVVDDGDQALDFLHQRGDFTDVQRPSLVLLDMDLPRTNGQEVLESIHDDPELSLVPVNVFTGSDAEQDVVRCYDLSANAFLTKPDRFDRLISMVNSIEEFWFVTARLPPVPS